MILTCFLKVIELKTPFLVKTVYPYLIITSILEDLYNKKMYEIVCNKINISY